VFVDELLAAFTTTDRTSDHDRVRHGSAQVEPSGGPCGPSDGRMRGGMHGLDA
jgi:hypothetical protein